MKRFSTKGLPQTSLRKQLIDQTAHAIGGAALALLWTVMVGSGLEAVIFALAVAVTREVLQNEWSLKLGWWSVLDIVFWVVGAGLLVAFY